MTKYQDIIDAIGQHAVTVRDAFEAGEPAGGEIDAIWRLLAVVEAPFLRAYDKNFADVITILPTEVADRLIRWLSSHTEGEVALFWRHFQLPVAV